jgi:hypothetical protein
MAFRSRLTVVVKDVQSSVSLCQVDRQYPGSEEPTCAMFMAAHTLTHPHTLLYWISREAGDTVALRWTLRGGACIAPASPKAGLPPYLPMILACEWRGRAHGVSGTRQAVKAGRQRTNAQVALIRASRKAGHCTG